MSDSANAQPALISNDASVALRELSLNSPEQINTLQLLYEVSSDLTSILDREELLRRIAQHVKRIVNYHVFTVMLFNERSQHLEGVFAMHYENSLPAKFTMPLHVGITGSAAAQKTIMRIDDVREDTRYVNCNSSVEVRSELVVPLLLRDRLIGVLDLESTEPRAFTAEHERLLATLASFIAVALENSRLYLEATDNQRRLQDDLDTAREVQRQLLPTGAREVPGLDLAALYVPARELGGDFYDFLPYGQGAIALGLGDVSGKGTAAALYGTLATGTLRELVVDHAWEPAEMLALMNHRLYAARMDARFIAMVFAVYDAPTKKMKIANAGSPYPLLIREGKVQEIHLAGVPLGLLSGTQYDEVTLQLVAGDVLVLASDGILEAENAAEEQFGAARLNKLLQSVGEHSAANIAASILKETDVFSGPETTPHDDRTLLVMKIVHEPGMDFSKLPIIY